jgi:hypothetical protein
MAAADAGEVLALIGAADTASAVPQVEGATG